MCVCVRERERERGRWKKRVFVYVSMCMYVCACEFLFFQHVSGNVLLFCGNLRRLNGNIQIKRLIKKARKLRLRRVIRDTLLASRLVIYIYDEIFFCLCVCV